ncbi:MAG: NusG domain II-containing protein [Lachnospiraceae bacterium]|nr:NusG domain II-containing protein [Lachnospiraceae bacterium]
MKKHDIYLIAALLIAALSVFLIYRAVHTEDGAYALIEVAGREYARLPLDADAELVIPGENSLSCTLKISNGTADVTHALCPDKICRDHAPVSKTGETIICLPAKIVITIIGGEPAETDYVVGHSPAGRILWN